MKVPSLNKIKLVPMNLRIGLLVLLFFAGSFALWRIYQANLSSQSLKIENLDDTRKAPISQSYGGIPLFFIPNEGQMPEKVKFYAQVADITFYFTPDEAMFHFTRQKLLNPQQKPVDILDESTVITGLQKSIQQRNIQEQIETESWVIAIMFLDLNPEAVIEGRSKGAGKVNYYIGNDPKKWQQGLPTYHEVAYKELWPGVDMIFRGGSGKLKYKFILQPGAKTEDIQLAYRGAKGLSLDEEGNLLIKTTHGVMTDERPRAYQIISSKKVLVESCFILLTETQAQNAYGFKVMDNYDLRYPLIVE